MVTIVEQPSQSDYVFNVMPDWLDTLEDQFLVFGDNLIYSFGDRTNIFGDQVDVNVLLQQSRHFVNYDQGFN